MQSDLLPPELAVDSPPFSDDDLAAYFDHFDSGGGSLDEVDADPSAYRDDLQALLPVHRWRVTDDEGADWAGRKLARSTENLKRLAEQRDAYVRRITDWFAEVSRVDARTIAKMEALLEDYGARIREAGGPATLTLPSVVIKSTGHQPSADVANDELAATYWESLFSRAFHPAPRPDQYVIGDGVLEAWQEAETKREALADAITEALGEATPEDVVKRAAKVYVGPFRRLVTLGQVPDGHRAVVVLTCDHVVDMPCDGLDDLAVPSPGEATTCTACPADPIDGWPSVHVREVEVAQVFRPAVLGPDGTEVPGTAVDPGGVTVKAKPRG